jgi:hypothetical protein
VVLGTERNVADYLIVLARSLIFTICELFGSYIMGRAPCLVSPLMPSLKHQKLTAYIQINSACFALVINLCQELDNRVTVTWHLILI